MNVVLDKSRYRLGQATAASAVPQLNIREINLPEGGEEVIAIPTKPWTLAIKARAPNQVMVSGLGLSSEWSANLQIAGQPENPAITGRATLIRGDYEFAGRQVRTGTRHHPLRRTGPGQPRARYRGECRFYRA